MTIDFNKYCSVDDYGRLIWNDDAPDSIEVNENIKFPKNINNIPVTGISKYFFHRISIKCDNPFGCDREKHKAIKISIPNSYSKNIAPFSLEYDTLSRRFGEGITVNIPKTFTHLPCGFLNSLSANVDVPDTVKYIGVKSLSSNKEINLSENSELETVDIAAFSNSVLKLPICDLDGLKKLPPNIKNIESLAFYKSKGLEHFIFTSKMKKIASSSFRDVNTLKKVSYEDSCKITSISDALFRDCRNLTTISLPPSIEEIGNFAFFATDIREFTCPENLKTIQVGAFDRCHNLKTVELNESIKIIDADFPVDTLIKYNGSKDEWKAVKKPLSLLERTDIVFLKDVFLVADEFLNGSIEKGRDMVNGLNVNEIVCLYDHIQEKYVNSVKTIDDLPDLALQSKLNILKLELSSQIKVYNNCHPEKPIDVNEKSNIEKSSSSR